MSNPSTPNAVPPSPLIAPAPNFVPPPPTMTPGASAARRSSTALRLQTYLQIADVRDDPAFLKIFESIIPSHLHTSDLLLAALEARWRAAAGALTHDDATAKRLQTFTEFLTEELLQQTRALTPADWMMQRLDLADCPGFAVTRLTDEWAHCAIPNAAWFARCLRVAPMNALLFAWLCEDSGPDAIEEVRRDWMLIQDPVFDAATLPVDVRAEAEKLDLHTHEPWDFDTILYSPWSELCENLVQAVPDVFMWDRLPHGGVQPLALLGDENRRIVMARGNLALAYMPAASGAAASCPPLLVNYVQTGYMYHVGVFQVGTGTCVWTDFELEEEATSAVINTVKGAHRP